MTVGLRDGARGRQPVAVLLAQGLAGLEDGLAAALRDGLPRRGEQAAGRQQRADQLDHILGSISSSCSTVHRNHGLDDAPERRPAAVDAAQIARQALRRRLLADREQFAVAPRSAGGARCAGWRILRACCARSSPRRWASTGRFAVNLTQSRPWRRLAWQSCLWRSPTRNASRTQCTTAHGTAKRPRGVDECGHAGARHRTGGRARRGPRALRGLHAIGLCGSATAEATSTAGSRQHPQVTSIGVAWAIGEMADDAFVARAHDLPLTLVLTERGVVD